VTGGVLCLYASTHGHTARIAGRIAEALRAAGLEVDLLDAKHAPDADPDGRPGVIVAASLHGGRHQREVVDWVKRQRDALDGRPSAFVSVSLTAAEDTAEARDATRRCIDEFLDDTGWAPGRSIAVAGALQYREYDVSTRVLIRLMMRRGGHPTDTSHDYDYTDWDAVDRLAREFAAQVQDARAP
jgi:menaquinone-dependent protoporphyrinogen oxidase